MARGRAARILVVAGAVALAVGLVVGWLWRPFGTPEAAPTPTPTEAASIFDAEAGTCLAEFEDAWQAEYATTDCAGPHAAEVLGTVAIDDVVPEDELEGDAWPGDDVLAQRAVLACETLLGDDTAFDLEVRWPLEADWNAGERDYVCFAVAEPGASVTPTATG
ncbi:septum formation family protein [Gulosibacter faecalis]|uniref:Septum formation family protein n=1 Tax=Gulosibacter faecalis TaxID=272240 RepID=A0ABW5UV52_9MICO|nr:septum formation family protein [Gulosibacter faecalis]